MLLRSPQRRDYTDFPCRHDLLVMRLYPAKPSPQIPRATSWSTSTTMGRATAISIVRGYETSLTCLPIPIR